MHPNQPPQSFDGHPPSAHQPTTAYPVMGAPAAPPRTGQFPGTVHGRRPRPELRVRLGDALAAGGALLVALFSFAPFVGYSNPEALKDAAAREDLTTWFSAWGLETFLAPLSWWAIFAALGVIGLVAARVFGGWDREVLGFRPSHLKIFLALFCGFVLLGYALSAKTVVFGSELREELPGSAFYDMAFGWGGLLMLLGAMVATIGTVLDHLNVGPEVWPLPQQQQPYGHPHPGQPHPGYPAPGQPAPGYPQHPGQAVYQTTYPAEAFQPTQAYPQQQPAPGPYQPQPPVSGAPGPAPQPGQPQPEQPGQPQPQPGQPAQPQPEQPAASTPDPQPEQPATGTPAPEQNPTGRDAAPPAEAAGNATDHASGGTGNGDQQPASGGRGPTS